MTFLYWILSWFGYHHYPLFGGVPRSPKFAKLAKEFIKEKGGKCEATGVSFDLEVHHIKPYHLYPELELEKSNLIVLTHWIHFFLAHLGRWASWNEKIVEHAKWLRDLIANRPK